MLLNVFDIVTTIIQSFLLVWMTNNIAYKNNKISNAKYLISVILISSEIIIFTYCGLHGFISNILMVTGALAILMLFFRNNVIDALLGFGAIYSLALITAYFFISFYKYILTMLVINIPVEIQMILFVYFPVWMVYFLIYISRRTIINAMMSLKKIKNLMVFVLIIEYLLIILDTMRVNSTTENIGAMFEVIVYFVTLFFFIVVVMYFARINDNSKEVEILNKALNEKIIELKKIKHDFGSEISALYGLYQLGKTDRLGELLKSIVERYQNMNDAVNIDIKSSPLVTSVLNSAVSQGVNVMAVDEGNYEDLSITEDELLKLLSNIIRNSVDEIKKVKNPIIKYRSYNNYDGIVIMISNNGPEIPENVKGKMFQAGFSTKKSDNEDRGYGLSIVMDIIQKCKGDISVDSNKAWTTFTLTIPKK